MFKINIYFDNKKGKKKTWHKNVKVPTQNHHLANRHERQDELQIKIYICNVIWIIVSSIPTMKLNNDCKQQRQKHHHHHHDSNANERQAYQVDLVV